MSELVADVLGTAVLLRLVRWGQSRRKISALRRGRTVSFAARVRWPGESDRDDEVFVRVSPGSIRLEARFGAVRTAEFAFPSATLTELQAADDFQTFAMSRADERATIVYCPVRFGELLVVAAAHGPADVKGGTSGCSAGRRAGPPR